MFLVAGLGNPGKKYEGTRHNAGARAVDEIAANFQFPIFNFQSIFNAEISKGLFKNKKIILVKPQAFMNNSGIVVKKLIRNWKLEIKNLVVVHDDLDLPIGKIRIVKNRGAAGHKGVESVIKELETKNFIRVRIGIKPKFGKPRNSEKFVLQKFNKEEEKTIEQVTKKTAGAIEMILREGLEKTMNKFNK
jgi:PTH1 family peptidyl-tRNA hydrolase